MALWFRFYAEALDDPKVQSLRPELFKAWVNMLCVASKSSGCLPEMESLAFHLRTDIETIIAFHSELVERGLIDVSARGSRIHAWDKRQYKSDTSTERVKRFRKRSKTVSVTPPDTEPDTDTEPPKVPQGEDAFERFWEAYPKRDGSNPRKPAEQKFRIATRRVDPETIISAARAYAEDQRKRHGGKRSPYTKQASVWLNQECWTEYGLQPSNEIDWPGWVEAYRTDRVWKDILGPRPDQGGCRAPVEVLRENGFAG